MIRHNQKRQKRGVLLTVLVAVLFGLCACSQGKTVETLRSEAVASFTAGDYETALTQFNEALAAGRGQVSALQYDILQYRGECELRLGRYEDAEKTYEALLLADDDTANQEIYESIAADLGNIGAVRAAVDQLNDGNYEEAYTAFAALAVLDGSLVGKLAWFNQGVCAEYMQRYDEAYELFQEYLVLYPDDAEAQKEAAFLKTR